MKLNNIRILVNDFAKSFDFYHQTLGLKCTFGDRSSNFASFDAGLPSGIAIFKADLMTAALGEKPGVSPKKGDAVVLVLEVEEVDKTYENLQSKVRFLTPPRNMGAWGIRVAHLRDPEGNLIELFSAIK